MSSDAVVVAKWTTEYLKAMRLEGDPPADAAIAAIFQDGKVEAVNEVLRHLVSNEYAESHLLHPAVSHYLATTGDLPTWADQGKILRAEQLFVRFAPKMILILACNSLPYCYLVKDGVSVLALTGRLSGNPTRRLVETSQMVVDVMQPGGLASPEGRGRRSVQKVRLMHAAIRHLAPSSPRWETPWGLPINQQDLATTLMSFSYIGIEAMRKLGVDLSHEDADAYLHIWRVVGHLLGIRDEISPNTLEEAKTLTDRIGPLQFAPSQDGKFMTQALIGALQYNLPGNLLDGMPALLMQYLLGKERAAMLGIDHSPLAQVALLPLRLAGKTAGDVLRDSAAMSHIAERVGGILLQSMMLITRGGTRPAFQIPSELAQQWGVNWLP